MKTIKELSVESGICRATLFKAARDKRIPAYRSGATWIINDESPIYIEWFHSRIRKGQVIRVTLSDNGPMTTEKQREPALSQ